MAGRCIRYIIGDENMSFFLLGSYSQNAGPDNVNKALIRQSGSELVYAHSKNKFIYNIETVIKILTSNQVLISGVCAPRFYALLRIFCKRYSYLMHGCIKYENKINKLQLKPRDIELEEKVIKNAEHIICVSEGYAEWVKRRYPEYRNKITFVNNGIDLKQRQKIPKEPYTVAVSGGNRCIKNNLEVYKAVEKLNKEGIPCKLFIFGRKYPDNDTIPENDFSIYCGHLDKKEYYQKLDKISCFVLDSEVESFGLVVADALNCNCSLLLSEAVGSRCIMKTKEQDVIQDPHNITEIAEKIQMAFQHSNADRLFKSIRIEKCSEKAAYQRLKDILGERARG